MSCLDEATFMELAVGALPPARAAEVDAHLDVCPECRRLVAEVLRPLDASEADASTRALTGTPPRASPPAEGASPPRGSAVGRYLVLERLGEGGMGVVYAAYDPELDRRVALKLLRTAALGLEPEQGRAHLLREAQAMARVSHPNVVPVYDVGTFGDQVFLAMEYVEARTLRQWLREAPRSWREVRDAFLEAGRGLAAAHAAGLVHGDFKPENLLVGRDGRVRVTDFGLARFSTPSAPSADLPRGGGTPAYMAPEQLSGSRHVDARGDQFSFCAALYEGLQGERPFAGATLEALAAEVCAGRVRPARPGTAVPPWLHRVVLRGLEVEPERRYLSVEALLDALVDDPVARRWRWGRRGGAVALLLGAVGATHALHAYQSRACGGSAERALVGVWDEARRGEVEAAFLGTHRPFAVEAWARVRRSLDAYTSAWVTTRTAACEATRVRGEQSEEVLGRRLRCLDRKLAEVGALAQVLARADADVVGRALRAVESLPSPAACADVSVSSVLEGPGVDALVRARALGAAGRYAEGLAVISPVVEETRAAGDLPGSAEALLGMAELREQAGDYRGAQEAIFASLWAAEAGRQDEVAARAWTLAVRVSGERLEQYALGQRWSERADAALVRWGGDDVLRARLHGNVGRLLSVQGRHGEAVTRYQQALELLERTVGPESLAVADILFDWSAAQTSRGHTQEALALAQRAVALRERLLGPEHPEVGLALAALAEVRCHQEEFAEAERVATRAVDVLERALGPEHPEVGLALNSLASAWLIQGRELEAVLPLFERALRLVQSSEGPESSHAAVLVNNLGSTLRRAGRLPEAVRHYTQAISQLERKLGPEHPTLVIMLVELGETLGQQGRFAEALPHLERAASLQGALADDVHGMWGPSLLSLGRVYLAMGRAPEARVPLSRLVAGRQNAHPPRMVEAVGRFLLAHALWKVGEERDRALRLAAEARERVDEKHPDAPRFKQAVDAWLARHRLARAGP